MTPWQPNQEIKSNDEWSYWSQDWDINWNFYKSVQHSLWSQLFNYWNLSVMNTGKCCWNWYKLFNYITFEKCSYLFFSLFFCLILFLYLKLIWNFINCKLKAIVYKIKKMQHEIVFPGKSNSSAYCYTICTFPPLILKWLFLY